MNARRMGQYCNRSGCPRWARDIDRIARLARVEVNRCRRPLAIRCESSLMRVYPWFHLCLRRDDGGGVSRTVQEGMEPRMRTVTYR